MCPWSTKSLEEDIKNLLCKAVHVFAGNTPDGLTRLGAEASEHKLESALCQNQEVADLQWCSNDIKRWRQRRLENSSKEPRASQHGAQQMSKFFLEAYREQGEQERGIWLTRLDSVPKRNLNKRMVPLKCASRVNKCPCPEQPRHDAKAVAVTWTLAISFMHRTSFIGERADRSFAEVAGHNSSWLFDTSLVIQMNQAIG